jgi:4-hydroxymandelate oxidase
MIVSTSASMTVEDIAPHVSRRWFQLYWFTDREFTRDLVARAEAAGYQALCLTVDTPSRRGVSTRRACPSCRTRAWRPR